MRNAMLFGYLGIRYSKRQPKLIAAVHSTKNVNVMVDVMDLLIYKSILKKCAQVWFVSSSQKDRWVRRMPFLARKAITIHNGIDLDEFEPTRFQTQGQALKASLGITEDENVLCLVSVNYSFSRIDSMILLPNGICCLIVFVIEIWEVLGFAQVSASKLGWS